MKPNVPEICQQLQLYQRRRAELIKSRIMQENRLRSYVALSLDYHTGLSEAEREEKFKHAELVIQQVRDGADHPAKQMILTSSECIGAWKKEQSNTEKPMTKLSKQLPVASWVEAKEQRGFGLLMLAIVVGETGDLSNYANPAKVWRRMGCAPWEFNGHTAMGATWKSGREGKLPGEEWERFGYSPRRRSIAYLIGEGMVKQNSVRGNGNGGEHPEIEAVHAGPYRARYDQTKAKLKAAHPDYSDMRCHLHGMLLATKLLLKNLWIEWNGRPPNPAM